MVAAIQESVMLKGMNWREGKVAEAGSTDRVKRLSAVFHKTRPSLCFHQARAYTEVFKKTEDEPLAIRKAKAFAKTLEIIPPQILDDELIVSFQGCKPRCIGIKPELHSPWLRKNIDVLSKRDFDPYIITKDEIREFREEIAPY